LRHAAGRLIRNIRRETAVDPDLAYHTQLWDIYEYLHPPGYHLFGFYDQWENTLSTDRKAAPFDAAFISPAAQKRV
jgi:hypothetical protein